MDKYLQGLLGTLSLSTRRRVCRANLRFTEIKQNPAHEQSAAQPLHLLVIIGTVLFSMDYR